jgi:hypothetical protein
MVNSYSINTTIAKKIDSSNQDSRIILFDNTTPSNTQGASISTNAFLKNLKAFSNINSLAEATLPDIKLEDSDQERLIKILNIEWTAARIQLDLEVSSDGTDYIKIGSVSLINQMGYPYKNYSLLDFYTDGLAAELGANGKIACSIKDVGYGKLTVNDELTIYGSLAQEIVINEQLAQTNIAYPITIILAAGIATLILGNDSTRKGTTIFNGSDETIFIGYNNTISDSNYSIRLSPGKGYEFPSPIFVNDVFAYSINQATLQVTDFYYLPQTTPSN